MAHVMTLYLDDSGTRDPDRKTKSHGNGYDWFALGGILVDDEDKELVEQAHDELCKRWGIKKTEPLHSAEIRKAKGNFKWLRERNQGERNQFYDDLGRLVTSEHLTAVACVIDRPGYNARYQHVHAQRWWMCKTAFAVVVERAAKFARKRDFRLRVYVEQGDPSADARIKDYYKELRATGLPFSTPNSAKYNPLTAEHFTQTLKELQFKPKDSALMQLADIALYPICRGKYEPSYTAWCIMQSNGVLIDSKVLPAEVPEIGIKYSCWPAAPETPKPDHVVTGP